MSAQLDPSTMSMLKQGVFLVEAPQPPRQVSFLPSESLMIYVKLFLSP